MMTKTSIRKALFLQPRAPDEAVRRKTAFLPEAVWSHKYARRPIRRSFISDGRCYLCLATVLSFLDATLAVWSHEQSEIVGLYQAFSTRY